MPLLGKTCEIPGSRPDPSSMQEQAFLGSVTREAPERSCRRGCMCSRFGQRRSRRTRNLLSWGAVELSLIASRGSIALRQMGTLSRPTRSVRDPRGALWRGALPGWPGVLRWAPRIEDSERESKAFIDREIPGVLKGRGRPWPDCCGPGFRTLITGVLTRASSTCCSRPPSFESGLESPPANTLDCCTGRHVRPLPGFLQLAGASGAPRKRVPNRCSRSPRTAFAHAAGGKRRLKVLES